jgi:NAD(P)-dependent dehydrogenase (short-subunit alcohol dehydrogenase family)
MADTTRVAAVSAANGGIGLEICRQLARRGLTVVLTSRSAVKGRTAAKALRDEGLQVETHLLDVTSPVGIQALAAEVRGSGILVNAACPGWVRTTMGGPNAPLSVEQGADTAVWFATLPEDGPSGGFFRERKAIPW